MDHTVWHRFTIDEPYDDDAIGLLFVMYGFKDDWALVMFDHETRCSPKSLKNIICMADRHRWLMIHVNLETNVLTLLQPLLISAAARPMSKKYKRSISNKRADYNNEKNLFCHWIRSRDSCDYTRQWCDSRVASGNRTWPRRTKILRGHYQRLAFGCKSRRPWTIRQIPNDIYMLNNFKITLE